MIRLFFFLVLVVVLSSCTPCPSYNPYWTSGAEVLQMRECRQ